MRSTKIWNISLPPEMARAAEKTAREEARTKSELVREALRLYLWDRRWKAIRRYGERKAGERGHREEGCYLAAKKQAFSHLEKGCFLGGKRIKRRELLHER